MNYSQKDLDKEVKQFEKITQELVSMKRNKGMDYGNSWSILGLEGVVYQIGSKFIRIFNLRHKDPKNESLRDSFIDLATYAIMGAQLLDNNDTKPKI
tara:strand:+ start:231 stop:521 length:291 start_codon:yes stop_codon:yes gene_type:complete